MTNNQPQPQGQQAHIELETEVKATVLRPLADKFQELTRQIDSGEYDLPKTIQEAEAITEGYITQAWERLEQLIEKREQADKPCNRNYNDGNAHTVRVRDGVACCPSCKQPIKEHTRVNGKTEAKGQQAESELRSQLTHILGNCFCSDKDMSCWYSRTIKYGGETLVNKIQEQCIQQLIAQREQAGRWDERKSFASVVFQACQEANLSAPDERAIQAFVGAWLESLAPKQQDEGEEIE